VNREVNFITFPKRKKMKLKQTSKKESKQDFPSMKNLLKLLIKMSQREAPLMYDLLWSFSVNVSFHGRGMIPLSSCRN